MALPLVIPVAVGLGRLAMLGYRAYQGYRAVRTAQAVTATAEAALAAERARKAAQLAQAAAMAQQLAQTKARDEPCDDCPCHGVVVISKGKYPESAQHILDAQAAGNPATLTIDRPNAAIRRAAATGTYPREAGKQPDEYPPAMFLEGGAGASVRNVTAGDNMGAGASMGNQLRKYRDGCKATITVGP